MHVTSVQHMSFSKYHVCLALGVRCITLTVALPPRKAQAPRRATLADVERDARSGLGLKIVGGMMINQAKGHGEQLEPEISACTLDVLVLLFTCTT